MTICITVDLWRNLEYYHRHLRLSTVSVGLLVACIAVGTRKWSSVLVGLELCARMLVACWWVWPRSAISTHHWIKMVRQANYAQNAITVALPLFVRVSVVLLSF